VADPAIQGVRGELHNRYAEALGEDARAAIATALVVALSAYRCDEHPTLVAPTLLLQARTALTPLVRKREVVLVNDKGPANDTEEEEDAALAAVQRTRKVALSAPAPDVRLGPLLDAAVSAERIHPIDREIFLLKAQDLNATEIGQKLGLDPARVRKRLSRASEAIRTKATRRARGLRDRKE
jgi:hypothetical protein